MRNRMKQFRIDDVYTKACSKSNAHTLKSKEKEINRLRDYYANRCGMCGSERRIIVAGKYCVCYSQTHRETISVPRHKCLDCGESEATEDARALIAELKKEYKKQLERKQQ